MNVCRETVGELIVNEMLDAPCVWCGYNGQGYWQEGTHGEYCPWRKIGGEDERVHQLPRIVKKLRGASVPTTPSQNDG